MLLRQLAESDPPVVAILRGVRPDEVLAIGEEIIGAGVRVIEIPLNSPDPLRSIERLSRSFASDVVVGAGTVLSVEAVDDAAAAGARLIVSPNVVPAVIRRSVERGLVSLPGFMTATEAFAAYEAGARDLKLFPAASAGVPHLKALLDVLPVDCDLWPTGGTDAGNFADWLAAGAGGIAVGSALYKPGDLPDKVGAKAAQLTQVWREIRPAK
jgi:2-dehydro-3-deoxyphosphogalactonate aldolase